MFSKTLFVAILLVAIFVLISEAYPYGGGNEYHDSGEYNHEYRSYRYRPRRYGGLGGYGYGGLGGYGYGAYGGLGYGGLGYGGVGYGGLGYSGLGYGGVAVGIRYAAVPVAVAVPLG